MGTYACGATAGTSSGYFSLGTNDASTPNPFNGYIDDLKIYNSAIGFTPMVPMNYSYSAVSGTGQYMACAVASGGLFLSSNYGSTWSQVTSVIGTGAWSSLALSHTGQYMLANGGGMTSPQLNGLATSTWTVNGVTWTASSSSNYSTFSAYGAFNNIVSLNNTWPSAVSEYTAGGSATGSPGTTIITSNPAIGSTPGAWIQLQSSVPLVMYSYNFSIGGTITYCAKLYYIVGSNDGITWYPIQYVNMGATNPFTATYQNMSTNILVNFNGTQTVIAGATASATTTTYTSNAYNTTSAYTYFRFITTNIFATSGSNLVEFAELNINFVGGQSYSTNYGGTWTNSLNTYVPTLNGLTTSSWQTPNGVTWTASASSAYSGTTPAYNAFNNVIASNNTWASGGTYNTSGSYTGSVSTTILGGVGSKSGEWLQIQSSIPLAMYSFTYSCESSYSTPYTYYFVGSNDGSNWYPIQSGAYSSTNPFTSGATYGTISPYILINYNGSQSITSPVATTLTTTAYSTSTNAYTYFRLIVPSMWNSTPVTAMVLSELYINFVGGTSTQINSTIATPNCLALSANGQYAIGGALTNTLISNLQFEGAYTDTVGGLTNTTGVATNLSFSSSIYKVGTQSLFCNNTAGGATPSYANYTLPSSLNTSSAITISFWIYPTSYPATMNSCPIGFNNGATLQGTYFNITPTGLLYMLYYTPSGASIASINAVPLNTWSLITGALSGGIVSFYINGILQGTASVTSVFSLSGGANMTNMFVGALMTSAGSYAFAYAGYIDDIRIYNRAITAAQVTDLYNSSSYIMTSTTLYNGSIVSNYLGGFATNSSTALTLSGITANIVAAACSNTGAVMVLITSGTTNNVYYSLNYGSTWSALTIGTVALTGCAVNYDGSYITVSNATNIYTLNSNTIGNSVALGVNAGQTNQGSNTIAIGSSAGQTNQTANSIILNASGSALNSYTSGFYVAPIASALASTSQSFALLGYGADNQVVQSGLTFTTTPQTIYGEWVQLQLATAVSITSYAVQGRLTLLTRQPASFALVGSNDATYWTILDTQTAGWGTYTLKSASPVYSYFRVIYTQVTNNNGPYVDMGGFILYNNGNSVFGPNANYTIAASGMYNQLQLNNVTVCTVTFSWVNTISTNSLGIYNPAVYGVNNPIAQIPTSDGYLKGSGYFLSVAANSVGPTYEYNSSYVAIQGTSTVANSSVLNGNVQVSGTYSSYTSGLLNITNTNTNPIVSFSVLGPNALNANVAMLIGQSATTNNSFFLSYMHVGGGSTYNYLAISPFGGAANISMAANGNVGVGTTNPAYPLDVYSSTGILTRYSTTSVSMNGDGANAVVAITAASSSGGAIVRFQRSSMSNVWDLRQDSGGSLNAYLYGTFPNVSQTFTFGTNGTFSANSKSFDIVHPLHASDPTKRLMYGCIEGPRYDLILRGKKQLINGTITVDLDLECTESPECAMTPGTFVALATNSQVFVTNNNSFDRVIGTINGSILTITSENPSSNVIIYWMVIGERKDMHSINSTRTNEQGYLITEYTDSTRIS